ncbi:MAG: hypothetical protein QW667_07600 [Candidatus Bathyarchaeia archaeon]
MSMEEETKIRPSLSVLALISFIGSFVIARAFTTFYPNVVLIGGGYHIHHFWFGLAMLAIGGWIGITLENKRANRIAAILFGAGGGLIGDEVGLLLTLESESYWTEITYTIIIIFLSLVSTLILISKYGGAIRSEFAHFLSSNASLYVGIFLAAVSVAFILETNDLLVTAISGLTTIIACIIILMSFAQKIKRYIVKKET